MVLGRAHIVHIAVSGTLSAHAALTLAAHSVSPEWEAVAFFVGTVAAVWANDIERKVRHPHLITFKRKEAPNG